MARDYFCIRPHSRGSRRLLTPGGPGECQEIVVNSGAGPLSVVLLWLHLVESIPINQNLVEIRSEFLYGRNVEDYRYVINNLYKLREKSWRKHGIEPKYYHFKDDLQGVMDDIILTREDIDGWLHSDLAGTSRRLKRNIVNFDEHPERKWSFPIPYYIDTATIADAAHQTLLRQAVTEWAERTCLSFQEMDSVDGVQTQYLHIHGDSDRCSSYIGRQDEHVTFPQYVNMNSTCFSLFGIAIHELGHAVGLHHEHQRPDRDDYVDIIWQNIIQDQQFNFEKETSPDVTLDDNPYGYNSVMHYGALHFSLDEAAKKYTISPKNADFLSVIGQQSQLTFYDVKVINTAYCSDLCSNQLSCQNGGYQDPENCNQCICPDEWSGIFCEDINPGSAGCGPFTGYREHDSDQSGFTFFLHTPRSDAFNHFIPGENCFWKIKVPENLFIKFWFGEAFGLLESTSEICLFWVEIRNPSETQARRYCGYYNDKPPFLQYSETNEATILFQSFSGVTTTPFEDRSFSTLGFRLYYKFSTCSNSQCEQAQCSCQEFLDESQQTHEDLCVTRSWCRNNGYPDPSNCGQCVCADGWTGAYCTQLATENLCDNTVQCFNGGQQDPLNCNQCVCPEERTGSQCRSIATGSEGTGQSYRIYCSQPSGSYTANLIGVTYAITEGSFTQGKKCFWKMTSPENTYLEFTLASTFGLYKSVEGTCLFWLEIFDPTLDTDNNGRRFCGFQGSTAPVVYRSKSNTVFIIFNTFGEDMYPDLPADSTVNFGFSLHFKPVSLSTTTEVPNSPTTSTEAPVGTSPLQSITTTLQSTAATTEDNQMDSSTRKMSTPSPEDSTTRTTDTTTVMPTRVASTESKTTQTSTPSVNVISRAGQNVPVITTVFLLAVSSLLGFIV